MLQNLQVRNFAIIDAIDIELGAGMTVLTGETGAGKSILVDALGLVLGERGGTGLVRSNAERAEFSAEFDLDRQPHVREWLAEQSLDHVGECLVRRVIGADGRSRAFINGIPVVLQSLKDLGEQLLDIHGQHFHQSLGKRKVQLELVDHFGALDAQREACEKAFAEWQSFAERMRELRNAESDRSNRLDLLAFQARELEALDLKADECESLVVERQRMRMGGQLAEGVTKALQDIFDDDSPNVQTLLADACQHLESMGEIDSELYAVKSLLDEASIHVVEAADSLQRYRESLEFDAARRDWVEERLDAISKVARKHRVEPGALPALQESLQRQLDDLNNAEAIGNRLTRQVDEAAAVYLKCARTLSVARQKTAAKFAQDVSVAMQGLGMPDGRFEVAIQTREPDDARSWGLDDIEYRISANAGQPPMPLSKVASGGELSRMSLAIQVIASDGSAIPTMVFDEVDSGVGGSVAEMVGRRLKELGATRQVLCVTHLPQVASLADCHFEVVKRSDGKSTRTEIVRMSEEQRVEELARMLGGLEITEHTRRHAAEMRKLGKRPGRTRKARTSAGGRK
ncbi:MAG TPA: DNA repair protein RecN [Woeseiaceae bacterium]|nr:DNA repair protein RecN [Woeseiaceae bacterium]